MLRRLSIVLILDLLLAKLAFGYSGNPPNNRYQTNLNCSSCHSGNAVNAGSGTMSITGLPIDYIPGETYDLAVIISDPSASSYGFQLAAIADGLATGSLSAVSSGMRTESGAIEHSGVSSTGSWNFRWTAPSSDQGVISFYASGVAANGNGSSSGDYVYVTSEDLSPTSSNQISMDWNASTGGVIYSSPTIGPDGTIFIGSNDNLLHAFNPDGSTKWTFTTSNWVDSTAALSTDGTLYVGSWDNKLYAIDSSNGIKSWEFETNSYVVSSPAIGTNGRIYFGSKDSIFYALESNGSVAWEYFVGQPISSSASIGQDGTIYFGDENGTFHALNSDGTSKWTYEVEDVAENNKSILSSPALDLSGNIYFGSGNGYCYSLSDNENNATLNWKTITGDRVDVSPVLGMTNEVYFVSRDGYLRSLSILTGGINWDAFVGDVFYSTPAIDENGRVYVIGYTGNGDNHLFAFESNGSKAWDTNQTDIDFSVGGIVDSSLAITEDGKLYYGCYDGSLYCINLDAGPAESDWSMFKRNAMRDGAWPSYSLEISLNNPDYGIVSGDGVYNPGATAIITATPSTGYSFDHWSGNGTADPDSAETTVEMSEDRNLVANFSPNSYEVSVSIQPSGTAVVEGGGTYLFGETVQLSISSVQTGYEFAEWSGDISGITDSLSFTLEGDVSINANLGLRSHQLNLSATTGGSVSESGLFSYGDSPEIIASPMEGYDFSGWSGYGVTDPNSATTTVSMVEDRNLTANFTIQTFTLSVSINGQGSITGAGNFNYDDLPTISATPSTGYSFLNWEGNGITDAQAITTTVSMTQDRNVTAVFVINPHSLELTAGEGGSVNGGGNFSYGTEAPIEAIPEEGYSFISWFGHEVADINSPQTTVNITEDISLSAIFAINQQTITITSSTGGTTTGAGIYDHGTTVNINAIPDPDYLFARWEGSNISDENASSTTLLVTQNQEISAVFQLKPLEERLLVLTSSPLSAGTTSGSGSYLEGSSVAISATPSHGYSFSHWTEEYNLSDYNSSQTEILLQADANLTAHFAPLDYRLEIIASEGGTVSGSGVYPFASQVTVSAFPQDGYHFESWQGESIENPLLETIVIELSQDLNLTASFQPNQYSLALNGNEGGTIIGAGDYFHGSTATITASPLQGYEFLGWSSEDLNLSSESSIEITMLSNYEISANFQPITLSSISGVEDLGSNWYGSDWLGYFHFTSNDWCYHLQLGWLYTVPLENDNLWAWSPKLGWLWLSSQTFIDSLAWSRDDSDWIFFSFEGTADYKVYHYGNETWSTFDPNEEVSLEESLF